MFAKILVGNTGENITWKTKLYMREKYLSEFCIEYFSV
jgi:hypothetical protein